MLNKILNFIKYNNAFTLGIMFLFFGFGVSLASSPELRGSIYSSDQKLSSIDNYVIVSTNLDLFKFNLTIKSVTEDDKTYYITYTYKTILLDDGIWKKDVLIEKTLSVNKEFLNSLVDKDLGLYVANQLSDQINYELSFLKRVQEIEKGKGLSKKIITTKYAGLIGKMLDPKDEEIEGYKPVILTPEPEDPTIPKPDPEVTDNDAPKIIEVGDPKPVVPVVPSFKPPQIIPEPSLPPVTEPATEPTTEEEIISESITDSTTEPTTDSTSESTPETTTTDSIPEPTADSANSNDSATDSTAEEESVSEEIIEPVVDIPQIQEDINQQLNSNQTDLESSNSSTSDENTPPLEESSEINDSTSPEESSENSESNNTNTTIEDNSNTDSAPSADSSSSEDTSAE